MCGIIGVIEQEGRSVEESCLESMLREISHRGPDGEGYVLLNHRTAALGHRRLSVIDLTDYAKQPMQTTDTRYTITYNGELYNYRSLRKTLEEKGYVFFSHSDTEVVLNAYAEWKEKCLDYFNGMFAFAVWDERDRELFIARDRYGIKPVYYSVQNGRFIFASEQKAILKYPGFRKKLNLKALKEYFTFQNIFSEDTFLEDIYILEAGCYLRIKPGFKEVRPVRYWDYNFEEAEGCLTEQEYLEELTRLFQNAVKSQMLSDVEIGTYLSGGMDSGAITAVAAGETPYIKSFTCGFDLHSASGIELSFDERSKAEYMSYLFKTEHYEMVLKAGDMERAMKKAVWHIEDPRVGQSYPNFYVSQLASKFVKVVLSGDGGDELFGGYPWRYFRSVNNNSFDEYIDKYYNFWQRMIPEDAISKLFGPVQLETKDFDCKSIFRNVFKKDKQDLFSPGECVNHSLYFEAKTFLHGLLVVEDKLSMAHSLETRVPFLDNDLVDFAMKLPVRFKVKKLKEIVRLNENEAGTKTEKYYKRTNDGKLLLRKAMENILPPDILKADKQGFSAPDATWFRGESIEYVQNVVMDNHSPIYDYLDRNMVRSIIREHVEGNANHRLFIWSILNFHEWCGLFL